MTSSVPEAKTTDNWFVACDDPSVYAETGRQQGQLGTGMWRPDPNDVAALYGGLEAMGGVLPLKWSWPQGRRRPPTPGEDEEYETDEEQQGDSVEAKGAGGAGQAVAAMSGSAGGGGAAGGGFDFDEDEDLSGPGKLTPRRPLGGQRELKGSAKKKTTDFKNIISNIQRHKQMDAARAKQQQQKQ